MFLNYNIVRLRSFVKKFSTTSRNNFKVAILGGAGGVGTNLGMLLKKSRFLTEIAIYDISPLTCGVALDLAHINTSVRVSGYEGLSQIKFALTGTSVVVILAGRPLTDPSKREDLFDVNANVIYELSWAIGQFCPGAIVIMATEPVNAFVHLTCEVLNMMNPCYNPYNILGMCTLNLIRAQCFVSAFNYSDPRCQYVPVVGGNCSQSIVPLFSQSNPPVQLSDYQREKLTHSLKTAEEEVIEGRAGKGSSVLSMSQATLQITESVLKGLWGYPGIYDYAYVRSNITEAPYFCSLLKFGICGVEKINVIGKVIPYEQQLINSAVETLNEQILPAERFIQSCGK